jgi:hypothetical protein
MTKIHVTECECGRCADCQLAIATEDAAVLERRKAATSNVSEKIRIGRELAREKRVIATLTGKGGA